MIRCSCLILYALVIGRISAVPVALRDEHLNENLNEHFSLSDESLYHESSVTAKCEKFSIKIKKKNSDKKIQIPTKCLGYRVVGDATCVKLSKKVPQKDFPIRCTFKLEQVETMETLNQIKETVFLSEEQVETMVLNESKEVSRRRGPRNEAEMDTWASKAVAKSVLAVETCKPDTAGKPAPRAMGCRTCWKRVGWGWASVNVPYICSCGCGGWNQVGVICFQPCHGRGEYTFDSGFYCHKQCNRVGQMNDLVVGCGLGHDRVCVKSSGACALRWVSRVWDCIDVLSNFVPGAGQALKAGAKIAKTAARTGARAARTAAKKAMKATAQSIKSKLTNKKFIKDAFNSYGKGRKDAILEYGATTFLTSNLPSDAGAAALEIAKLADPTGVVSMVAGWIPPAGCNKVAYCKFDDCPSPK